jgi:sulfite reductase (ferredoxin)
MSEEKKPSHQEAIKLESKYLKGTIAEELADSTTNFVSEESYELLKFHGTYQGYNRDTATARKQAKLEKEYEFMVRLKIPAGRITAEQYLAMDKIAGKYANGTLRITTRETFQFHCIVKGDLKAHIADVNKALLSTLGGCGDVVRNIMACPAPIKDNIHQTLERDALAIAALVAPKTPAYHEIWLDGEKVDTSGQIVEPLYGEFYLPRKFKIGISTPEDNCIDVMTHDLAILSLFEDGKLKGYNFALGGGLGMTHNKPNTYPRLASPIAFVPPELLLPATEAVIKLQRDHGDRSDRKHSRLKYVVEEKGIAWTRQTFEEYIGRKLDAPYAMPKFAIDDHLGWHEQGDGKWFLGIPVSSGRIIDREGEAIRSGLRSVISTYKMPIVLTADQNIILADIEPGEKGAITQELKRHGIKLKEDLTRVYQNFLACVALPTCGKALAEAERVKLPLVAEIEKVMEKNGVLNERISIRIAGCPNGCSRPYVGDIGIVGRTPDSYVLFIGGDFEGTRLNKAVFDKVPLKEIPEALNVFFANYAANKQAGEGFGDFCERLGVEKVVENAKEILKPNYKWAA